MRCRSCEAKVTKVLEKQKGVASTEVNAAAGKVIVWYDSHTVHPEKLAGSLTDIGYGSSLFVIMPVDKYMAMTGKTGGTRASAKGCGGSGCCVK